MRIDDVFLVISTAFPLPIYDVRIDILVLPQVTPGEDLI